MRDRLNDPIRLELILEAISNIEEFLLGSSSYENLQKNKILSHAIIYNLQCIGECSYKLSREFVTKHSEIDWEAIEGLRHVLVHDYYTVDLRTIWAIIEKDLPVLKAYVEKIK